MAPSSLKPSPLYQLLFIALRQQSYKTNQCEYSVTDWLALHSRMNGRKRGGEITESDSKTKSGWFEDLHIEFSMDSEATQI